MKKSILLLFHGSMDYEESEKIYEGIRSRFKKTFSDFYITYAYSSSAIRKKFKEKKGIELISIEKRLSELKNKNIEEVFVTAVLLINNKDYGLCVKEVLKFSKDFSKIYVTSPILSFSNDYKKLAAIIEKKYNDKNYSYLFVGHGGRHHSNSAFGMLGYTLYLINESFFTITFDEGIPFDMVKDKIARNHKNVKIVPLLITNGFHYKNEVSKTIYNEINNMKLNATVEKSTLGEWDDFISLLIDKTKGIIN